MLLLIQKKFFQGGGKCGTEYFSITKWMKVFLLPYVKSWLPREQVLLHISLT